MESARELEEEWGGAVQGLTYFSKSGAKSAALDSFVKPVTYSVDLGIVERVGLEAMDAGVGKIRENGHVTMHGDSST